MRAGVSRCGPPNRGAADRTDVDKRRARLLSFFRFFRRPSSLEVKRPPSVCPARREAVGLARTLTGSTIVFKIRLALSHTKPDRSSFATSPPHVVGPVP